MIQHFYRLYSIKAYYKTMALIPCAIQYILVAYLFYTQQFVSLNPISLICPPLSSVCYIKGILIYPARKATQECVRSSVFNQWRLPGRPPQWAAPHSKILSLRSCLDLFQESIASLCDTSIARPFLLSLTHLLFNESSAFHAQLSRQAQHISLPVSKRSVDLLGCLQTMLWVSVCLLWAVHWDT